MINHKNPSAVANPGTLLEVLPVAACCNAASVSVEPYMLLGDYFVNIAVQLGLPVNSEVIRVLEREESFGAVIVSRFILPGSDLPTQWKGLTGLATRQKNLSKFDLKLELMGSSEVRCEANDGANFSSNSLVGKCNIGLLVVRSCCNFLTGGQHLAKNLQYIQSIMRLFPNRSLG